MSDDGGGGQVGGWIDEDASRWFQRIEHRFEQLEQLVFALIERLNDMSAQTDVDKATAVITSATTTLNTDAPEIEAKLGQGVDTSQLDAALAPLQAAVAGISALANPVPTATATTTTSSPVSTSTVTTTSTTAPTTTASATATTVTPAAKTVGTGAPGDPVRPA